MPPAPMTLLSSGVPLTLLLDLVLGPHSEELLTHELPAQRESAE
ncbi:MAG: hypothetical protein ABR614_09045 [Mycobacteriales bacterium]